MPMDYDRDEVETYVPQRKNVSLPRTSYIKRNTSDPLPNPPTKLRKIRMRMDGIRKRKAPAMPPAPSPHLRIDSEYAHTHKAPFTRHEPTPDWLTGNTSAHKHRPPNQLPTIPEQQYYYSYDSPDSSVSSSSLSRASSLSSSVASSPRRPFSNWEKFD